MEAPVVIATRQYLFYKITFVYISAVYISTFKPRQQLEDFTAHLGLFFFTISFFFGHCRVFGFCTSKEWALCLERFKEWEMGYTEEEKKRMIKEDEMGMKMRKKEKEKKMIEEARRNALPKPMPSFPPKPPPMHLLKGKGKEEEKGKKGGGGKGVMIPPPPKKASNIPLGIRNIATYLNVVFFLVFCCVIFYHFHTNQGDEEEGRKRRREVKRKKEGEGRRRSDLAKKYTFIKNKILSLASSKVSQCLTSAQRISSRPRGWKKRRRGIINKKII